jgi:hypothetical protein
MKEFSIYPPVNLSSRLMKARRASIDEGSRAFEPPLRTRLSKTGCQAHKKSPQSKY